MSDSMFNEEQQMLADSARRYVERGYGAAELQASIAHPAGCLPEKWKEFGELGWLGIVLPEADGGFGGSFSDVCIVSEELGRGVVNEPFVASGIAANMLLAELAVEDVKAKWLPGLIDGSRRAVLAFLPTGNAYRIPCADVRARTVEGGFILGGETSLALGLAGADGYMVLARMDDGPKMGLFLLDAGLPGLTVRPCALYDGQGAGRLRLEDVPVAHALDVQAEPAMLERLARYIDGTIIAHCAQTVGTMQRAFEITLDYLKTRQQFGKPISANQVVQHRLVDLFVEIEEARALSRAAAGIFDECRGEDNGARRKYAAAAKACVAQVAKHCWKEAVQLHGAIGMTQEYVVGQYVKRLAAAATLYGTEEAQLETVADLTFDTVRA
ncbi:MULTISPECIES: acyl-CoA dehydrogenase family protein [Polaromonas]|uniref:Acyl-CoA dehydrogenase family protein n=1 Tax=Polaromonas aquatica TaxID=332657 RepID=A0ABW1U0P5_9BURK